MNSPEYIQTSLAAAMSLGFEPGSFKEPVRLTGLNILLTYDAGCLGKCAYCGIAGVRQVISPPSYWIYIVCKKQSLTFFTVSVGLPDLKIADPSTRMFAPALITSAAVSGLMPPSISRSISL